LALAPQLSLWLAAGLIGLADVPVERWLAFVVQTIIKCLAFGALLGLFTIAIGLPLYLVHRRLGWRCFTAYGLGAAMIAVALYLLPELAPRNETSGFSTATCKVVVSGIRTACGWEVFWRGLWLNALYGALAGLVFWLLLLMRNKPAAKAGGHSSTDD
jgi:hypothetical protein